jgi:hypothetical protein
METEAVVGLADPTAGLLGGVFGFEGTLTRVPGLVGFVASCPWEACARSQGFSLLL